MFCVKCGNQIDDGVLFCPYCGNKVGENDTVMSQPIIKSKKECIYDGLCAYFKRSPIFLNASFSDLENYEEGQDGKIYAEIVVKVRNAFGQTKAQRYGAVIKDVEADGNCVFATPGPQMINAISPAGWIKKFLGFKSFK